MVNYLYAENLLFEKSLETQEVANLVAFLLVQNPQELMGKDRIDAGMGLMADQEIVQDICV